MGTLDFNFPGALVLRGGIAAEYFYVIILA